jgi:hypothetical protein
MLLSRVAVCATAEAVALMKKALGIRTTKQLSEYETDVLQKVVSSAGGGGADSASAGCLQIALHQPVTSLFLAQFAEQQHLSLGQQNNCCTAGTVTYADLFSGCPSIAVMSVHALPASAGLLRQLLLLRCIEGPAAITQGHLLPTQPCQRLRCCGCVACRRQACARGSSRRQACTRGSSRRQGSCGGRPRKQSPPTGWSQRGCSSSSSSRSPAAGQQRCAAADAGCTGEHGRRFMPCLTYSTCAVFVTHVICVREAWHVWMLPCCTSS